MKIHLYISLFITLVLSSCSPSEEEFHSENAKLILKKWISINAKYPDTYKPLEFKDIKLVKVFGKDTVYRVTHRYELKEISGKTGEFEHFFVTKNDSISLITKEENSFIEATPPSTFLWSKKFGEKFRKVTQGNLGAKYNLSHYYNDYKLIGGEKYSYFTYPDKDCFTFLIQSIKNYDSTKIVLKRIVQAYPKVGHSLVTFDNKKEPEGFENLVVYTNSLSTKETVSTLSFDSENKCFVIEGVTQSLNVNETYINSNCFKQTLQF